VVLNVESLLAHQKVMKTFCSPPYILCINCVTQILIDNIYQYVCLTGPSRLLIVSGYAEGGFTKSAEVIDLTSKNTSYVKLADFPAPHARAIAGLDSNSNPIVCGGTTDGTFANSICYTYIQSTKTWTTSPQLTAARCKFHQHFSCSFS